MVFVDIIVQDHSVSGYRVYHRLNVRGSTRVSVVKVSHCGGRWTVIITERGQQRKNTGEDVSPMGKTREKAFQSPVGATMLACERYKSILQ